MDKRFTTVELPKPTQWGIWYDGAYLSTYQVCILLNEYVDVKNENEQLKQDNTNLRRTMSKERVRYLQFRDKVFDLINTKIKHYEHKPFSAPVGQPMSVNFDADVDRIARLSELQDLKKELKE